ncbi:hypothetical protein Cgig2_012031 [Carnegiea gigantea]|uniref:Response regulatory domain-containing protein n=1 Tax=Carnegiea gigantea TaxID=171969 RepID=A0A9Q1KNN6_9CARY|nr:hypothetical protein Cgig2_012031 [Carnegiea gigantea]
MDLEEHLKDDQEQLRHEEEEEEVEGHDEEQHNENDNFHVLAVDDSLTDRKILEKLLTLSSYHGTSVFLITYTFLKHGFHFYSKNQQIGQGTRVNLIMTDYSMPGITGYDLLKKVKGSSWKDIPVVVMSSENVPSRIHMCLEEGADEFLLKPVKLSDLKKLHPHLRRSTSQCGGTNRGSNKDLSSKDKILVEKREVEVAKAKRKMALGRSRKSGGGKREENKEDEQKPRMTSTAVVDLSERRHRSTKHSKDQHNRVNWILFVSFSAMNVCLLQEGQIKCVFGFSTSTEMQKLGEMHS